jgi:transposase-like protein
MTEAGRTWIREQANKVRAAHHVKPIRFSATPEKCPFCQQVDDHADHCPLARMEAK